MTKKALKFLLITFLFILITFPIINCENLKISKLKANYHFNKANKFFQDEMYKKAIPEYELTIKYDPEFVQAYHYLGESYKNLYRPAVETEENIERANKALAVLQKALELDPNNKDIILSLGDMYNKLRDFQEAEKYYLEILVMEPDNPNNYYVVAEFYKSYAGEIQKEEKEEEEETGLVRIAGEKIVEEEKLEEEGPKEKTPLEKAEEMYKKRIELDPSDPDGYARLANFYENLPIPEFDKAKEYYEKMITLDPNNATGYSRIGVNRWAKSYRIPTLPKEEKIKAAREGVEALKKAIEIDPTIPEPYAWLKVLYYHLGKLEPKKEIEYKKIGDEYGVKFEKASKRQQERKRLEEELTIIK
ncbi:MAG: tetratricopeptide repeat protein [Candidatus Aminicenantia bacterium]